MRKYNGRSQILVTGGAGFLGSLPREQLIAQGHEVICADNFFTGSKRNAEHLLAHPRFEHRFSGDPTNWWVPNHAGVEAMLRSSGLRVTARPAGEICLCEPDAQAAAWRREGQEQLRSVVQVMGSSGASPRAGKVPEALQGDA